MAAASAYPILVALRDALAAVPGVATCRIGLETNMMPDDYPMVRILPSTIRCADVIARRSCEILIYFGKLVHEFDAGLEALYEDLFEFEAALLAAAHATPDVYVQYEETILNEDRVDGYKLMAIKATLQG